MIPRNGSPALRSWWPARTAPGAIHGIALGFALLTIPRLGLAIDCVSHRQELVKVNSAAGDAARGVVITIAQAVPGQVVDKSVESGAGAEGTTGGVSQSPEHGAGEPGDVYAAPLAAALQAVHDQYAGSAKPIPADVREALAAEYGSELARARYVVSAFAVKLLTAIDQFQGTSLRDGLHAVTVDDIIVFSSVPSISDIWMWAHELHHVRQYQERGTIYGFALWYVNDCEAVEQAADDRANRVLGTSVSPPHCL